MLRAAFSGEPGRFLRPLCGLQNGKSIPAPAVALLAERVSRGITELGGELVFREAGGFEDVEVLVNGIPIHAGSRRRLEHHDLVTIDAGCRYGGWCADAGRTWRVSENGIADDPILAEARQALKQVIEKLGQDGNWLEASEVARGWIRGVGKNCQAELTGHGVGRELHEDPILAGASAVRVVNRGRSLAVELSAWSEAGRASEVGHGTECIRFEETIWLSPGGGEILTCDGSREVGLDRGNGVQSLAPLGVGCL